MRLLACLLAVSLAVSTQARPQKSPAAKKITAQIDVHRSVPIFFPQLHQRRPGSASQAVRQPDNIAVTLTKPKDAKLSLDRSIVFPTEHVRRTIDAAHAGKTIEGGVGGLLAGLLFMLVARRTFFPLLTLADVLAIGIGVAFVALVTNIVLLVVEMGVACGALSWQNFSELS
jgi:hypothetical protein